MTPTRRPPTRAAETEAYRTALETLARRRRFGLKPGLEAMHAVLDGLGHPERAYPSIHVTGSKGKGSVAAMAASILADSGRTVGLYTSPHLVSYRERIRVNGDMIPRGAVVEGLARIEALSEKLVNAGRLDRPPTYFEVTTALALDWFRAQGVDAGVVEVGIGGRLDATNVLDARVGVMTTVELEHTELLGSTLGEIAREKAGILHPGMRAVIGRLPPEARTVVERSADAVGVPLWHLDEEIRTGPRALSEEGQRFAIETPAGDVPTISLPLSGSVQAGNAALAVAAARLLGEMVGFRVGARAIRSGLSKVDWPGRLERLPGHPTAYVDVAHTPESVRSVAAAIGELHPFADPAESVVLFGCLSDKRYGTMLDTLSPLAQTAVLAPVRSERAAPVADLRREATGRFPRVVQAPDGPSAFALARAAVGPEGLLLVTGSDYLVGEILRSLSRTPVDEPDLSDPGVGTPIGAGAR